MKIEFLVQGSAIEPYKVTFQKTEQHLSASCTCPAGINGQYCKHRFSILRGEIEGIVSNNLTEVKTIVDLLAGTDIEDALIEMKQAEIDAERAKKILAATKKKVAAFMRS
jgi:uncharacterized Zn finger protein